MKRKFRLLFISTIISLTLILFPLSTALAATTQDVTVTATPAFISISNTPGSYDYGVVNTSVNGSSPQGHFTVTNTSSVTCNVSISVTTSTWAGGVTWTHSDTATPGSDTAGLVSSNNTGVFDTIVKNSAPNDIYPNLPASQNFSWELRLVTPTAFTDGVEKSITVRLTAAQG